jgi:puromycin-sensitive aminopeptidase
MKPNARLSKNVTPQRYALTIRPDLEAFTFMGEEIIDVVLVKSEKNITLHSKNLEILSGFFRVGKNKIEVIKISYNTKSETVTVQFEKAIPKGRGKLHLQFRGIISESLRGFYRSKYIHQGKTQHMAVTQFEATDARQAFPCFDEPAHKAVFELSVVVPSHLTVISNTVETATPEGIKHNPGYKVVKFKPTPKMSTYLLAYMIGDYEKSEIKTKNGVTIRIFTSKGKKHQVKFALDVTKRALEYLNDYFAIPYPMPVLDLVAIPDFSAGAMENWGAIAFRESALLIDEAHSAFTNKQNVAEFVTHELVHQWFGNLVTMEWWTHLWLNESFAPLMANMTMDHLFPEWKIWTRFVMHDHSNALHLDSLENTHPIEVEVHHPDQISEIFDAISYDKGASVLRMLKTYIGEDNFRNGLRYYLKKHAYKNTTSEHLWEAFEKVSKKPIRKFMKQWIGKSGYPLISVAETAPGKVMVSQSRFGLNKSTDKTLWPVPLQFELGDDKFSDLRILNTKQKQFSLSAESQYIKANPDETGFFRTMYSPSLLAKLYGPVKNKKLSVTDRFGIIRDLFAIIKSGRLPTSAYLEFLKAYENETSYIVWAELLSGMGEIYNLTGPNEKLQKKIAAYYLDILKNVVDKIGWTADHNESQSRPLLRNLVLHAYGFYGHKPTLDRAIKLFEQRHKKSIDPNLRSAVYGLYGMKADAKNFDTLQKMFQEETLQEEQRRIGRAIMSVQNPKLFKKSLDFAFSRHVRSQDTTLYLAMALGETTNRKLVWKWLQQNWKELDKRYHDEHLVIRIITSLGHFTTLKEANEISVFFKKHPLPIAQRGLKQAIERIKLNAAWFRRDETDIAHCINQLR